MLFSEYFGVNRTDEDDWFDPIFSIDTKLFIDPFLIYDQEVGFFEGSHDEIIDFFSSMFQLIIRSAGKETSVYFKSAARALYFPEVQELCLGYTESGTKGSGTGALFANIMAGALWEAVVAGIKDITHFEEIALLREGIGADRISDAVSNILRHRLAGYTLSICQRHNIPTRAFNYMRGRFDNEQKKWVPMQAGLPTNPYTQGAILLVPFRYLRELPTINAEAFWDYSYQVENETLRDEFGDDIKRNVPKAQIISFARRHPKIREGFIQTVEATHARAYDIGEDKSGYIAWYPATKDYFDAHPHEATVENESDFLNLVDFMVSAFKHFVEEKGGWYLLWNDDGSTKPERAAQLTCLGIFSNYCQANNIDINREAEVGRGPVDFKFSRGHGLRVLLEVKKANNTKFWRGLEKQLPIYLRAEGTRVGYFLVVILNDDDLNRASDVYQRVAELNHSLPFEITAIIVDARPKLSASRI